MPVLWTGNFSDLCIEEIVENLRITGSIAAPGFRNPEGVVIYHTAGNVLFKKTLDKDDQPKGNQ